MPTPVLDIDALLSATPALDRATDESERQKILAREGAEEGELANLAKQLRDTGGAHLYSDGVSRPNWQELVNACGRILKNTARTTRSLTWLVEGLLQEHGWAGFESGLRAFRQMVETHAATLRPVPGPGESRIPRYAALFNSNAPVGEDIKLPPLAIDRIAVAEVGNRRIGMADFEQTVRSMRKSPALDQMLAAIAAVGPDARAQWSAGAAAVTEELERFCTVVRADLTSDPALSPAVQKRGTDRLDAWRAETLGRIRDTATGVEALFEQSGGAGPKDDTVTGDPPPEGDRPRTVVVQAITGPVSTRAEAVRELQSAGLYFDSADPHSPVGYHIRCAQRWMDMPVTLVLDELVGGGHMVFNMLPKVPQPPPVPPATPVPEAAAAIGTEGGGAAETPAAPPPPPPPIRAASRADAIGRVRAVLQYLDDVEPHSFAKFPLAFAVQIVNIPLQQILEGVLVDESSRYEVMKRLGLTFKPGLRS